MPPCDRIEIDTVTVTEEGSENRIPWQRQIRVRVISRLPVFSVNRSNFRTIRTVRALPAKMAGLSSSTVQRGGTPSRQQASSDEMAEILRAWDDEDDEMVEFIQNSKADGQHLSRNANGLTAGSWVGTSRVLATYSPSSVRSAKTICLFISFFGLVSSKKNCSRTL